MFKKSYTTLSILITSILLLMGSNVAKAQTEITIIYRNNSRLSSIDEFIWVVAADLERYDVQATQYRQADPNVLEYNRFNDIIVVHTANISGHPQLYVEFHDIPSGAETYDTIVTVATNTNMLSHISPILQSNLQASLSIYNGDSIPIILGLSMYLLNNPIEAEQLLSNIQAEELLSGNIQFYLGNLQLLEGNLEEAIELYEQQPEQNIINLAWALFQVGRTEESFDLLSDAITDLQVNEPTFYVSYLLSVRAQLYALALDYDSAIADIDEAITLAEENELSNETLAELYTIRGELIFLIYEWDRVEDNFDLAIELNPQYARAYFQRGVLFYTMARREDALADFQFYLDLEADGVYAEEAQSYIDSIEIELEALGG